MAFKLTQNLVDIQPLKAPRLHQRIAMEIGQLIAAGTFKPGERLPAERQLAQSLQVSRSSLREALSQLELEGVLDIRVGSGAWVRRRPAEVTGIPKGLADLGASPFDLLHVRRILEPEAAALAAKAATPAQRAALTRAFEQLESDMRAHRRRPQADRDFHMVIAHASGNAALTHLIEELWRDFQSPLGQRMEALYVTPERRRDNVEEHRAILDAVVSGRAVHARQAMRLHLLNAERQRLRELQDKRLRNSARTS